ncbi:hypothetical protein EUV02_04065 [Polymorphobacter arshaanensis]|uniref:site-specific DNA-methyltransferase (adenine-specific) n=1 Tax=Glacieibacterium arshaanense TaxID=2511025 RepID=A0A4Y9ERG6_9SPHN|nr:type ISP restriction/modification enzyme [Polymorphobacter arshaanensis]TFU06194.1 hypothetical protein EUV02_04065 [Polymorphobacter arshaanensis]
MSERTHYDGYMIDQYILALRKTPLSDHTEMTGRGALETLLNAMIADYGPKGAVVTHEAKHVKGNAPDFKISVNGQIIAYVETKAIGANLDAVAKSDQIKRYRQLCPNVLLTDYLRFDWITELDTTTVRLGETALLQGKPHPPRADNVSQLSSLLKRMLSEAPQGIGRARDLAQALAVRAHLLREFLTETLIAQAKSGSGDELTGLYHAFKEQVSRDLTVQEFADAYAQTLAYGLFLAKLNAETITVTLHNAKDFIPAAVPLLRELVGFLGKLDAPAYVDIKWVVDEVLSIVNGIKLAAIHEDLSFRNRKVDRRGSKSRSEAEWRLFSRDPFIYFYEDFLEKYDKATKKARGVFYTPPPVVNFIVRAVNDILKDTFDIPTGLADKDRVTLLDFACGTGTFLVEVMEQIFAEIGGAGGGKAQAYVDEHLLKNLYGFEYLVAPYTIAHLKLSQYLKEAQLSIPDGARFQVYLTNTVEPMAAQSNFLLPALSKETEAAQIIKTKPILVITGNPPYAGHSKNNGPVATGSVAAYREGFPELSKPGQGKWLQDDYVKFIRFAQQKVDAAGVGIVAIITSHSFLDNPTFRGMRQSLMESFDQIRVIDLHGNTKKKEKAPGGSDDKNIFDIEQGVAISLLVKKKGIERGIWHVDVWGSRQEKYEWSARTALKSVDWKRLNPLPPQRLLRPRDNHLAAHYNLLWSISDILNVQGDAAPGIVTTHDEFAISHTKDEAIGKAKFLAATSDEEQARSKFRLCTQKQWSYEIAKSQIPRMDLNSLAQEILYRPFDKRWTIWNSQIAVHLRERVSKHLVKPNLAISVSPQSAVLGSPTFDAALALNLPADFNSFRRGGQIIFPLYLYGAPKVSKSRRHAEEGGLHSIMGEKAADPFADKDRVENIAPEFRTWLEGRFKIHFEPEALLGYIYAVLHAPAYRNVYSDFLSSDFPRIPFPENYTEFVALADLGEALVAAHLLKTVPKGGVGGFDGKGDNHVEFFEYDAASARIRINATQYFGKVSPEIWAFTIGGYQVLRQYLKARKGRVLTLDEMENVENVVNVLAFTIDQMAAIDTAYVAAFSAGKGHSPADG